MDKLYIGSVGAIIRVDVGQNITGATATELHVKKPDGTTAVWSAAIADENYLEHTVQAGDFDQAGIYRLQSAFALGGWVGTGESCEFAIYDLYN